MSDSRLSLALDEYGLSLPDEGRIVVFSARQGHDLSPLGMARVDVVQSIFPDHRAFERAGFNCLVQENEEYAAALVFLPRSKAQARDLIARASACASLVIVDGQKTDGIDSLLKECRKRVDLDGSLSKSHGKLFWFSGGEFFDWRASEQKVVEGGYTTRAGVFSADGVDPASQLLVDALPAKLGRNIADLGAGWGFLSTQILSRADIESLYLVEADYWALECARENVTDERAEFFWDDVTTWQPRARMDSVVMNPPFHTGRSAEPALGVAFIEAAARMLTPSGQLWMVANRHLPYETALRQSFAEVDEVSGDNRFKVLRAARPARLRR